MAAPGIWLQKLTTAVPDDSQIEVAVSSLMVALDAESALEVVNRGGVPNVAIAVRDDVFGREM